MRRSLLFLLTLLLFPALVPARGGGRHPEPPLPDGLDYGIRMLSYPVPANERTSLRLDGGSPIRTGGDPLELSFTVRNRPENLLGVVFSLVAEDGYTLSLCYQKVSARESYPILMAGTSPHPLRVRLDPDVWQPVSMRIDPGSGTLSMRYGADSLTFHDPGVVRMRKVQITFGSSLTRDKQTYMSEVASVDIRDILLARNGTPVRHWRCAGHGKGFCRDRLAGRLAVAQNPSWLIDGSLTLARLAEQSFERIASIAYDGRDRFWVVADSASVWSWQPGEAAFMRIPVARPQPLDLSPDHLLYVPGRGLTAFDPDLNIFAAFDTLSRNWDRPIRTAGERRHWISSNTCDPRTGKIYSFGGYGEYQFDNTLLVQDPADPDRSYRRVVSAIDPRRYASPCLVGDTLFLFGGQGNLSGHQGVATRNYYDLYAIDTRTLTVRQLWNAGRSPLGSDFYSSDMVYDPASRQFYVLSNQGGLTLLRFRRDKPVFEKVSLPVSLPSSHLSAYKLWRDPSGQRLYAAVVLSSVAEESSVALYDIAFPPLPVDDFIEPSSAADRGSRRPGTRFLPLLLLPLLAVSWLFLRRRRRSGRTAAPSLLKDPPAHYDFSRSCICLLGGFHVVDSGGKDITLSFSPMLRNLLMLLILYSTPDRRGISGAGLNQALWSYKFGSADNNRNVYMSKLRGLLEQVGGVRVVSHSRQWMIDFEPGTLCDYLEAENLLGTPETRTDDRLRELLVRGPLLSEVHAPWADEVRADFSWKAVDAMTAMLHEGSLSDTAALSLAEMLFVYDPINETALAVKVRTLVGQGKIGIARSAFDAFCQAYAAATGTEYPRTFRDFLS